MNKQFLVTFCFILSSLVCFADSKCDIIVTQKAERIEALITEVTPTEIKYHKYSNPSGPIFVLYTKELAAIIYKNGEVQTFQKQDVTQNIDAVILKRKNLAKVIELNGILVFSDCTPISSYEVLGVVSFSGQSNADVALIPVSNPNGGVGMMPIVAENSPQYTSIRNGLVTNAILANREVEGIIINLENDGIGKATMIKFTNVGQYNNYALVNCYSGIYVFTDNTPVQQYTYLGQKHTSLELDVSYTHLRDKLIKRCKQKYDDGVSAVIIRMVEGGKDTADAIKF